MNSNAPLEATPETLAAVKGIIVQTLDPNKQVRTTAEKQISELQKRSGYVQVLIRIVETEKQQQNIVLATAVLFKNYVKNNWDIDNPVREYEINENDRNAIKTHIVELMCNLPPMIQSQFGEIVRIISVSDFPENWQNLLPDIRQRVLNTQDFNAMVGLLETANVIFKMFRNVAETNELLLKLKYTLEQFQEPLLFLFKKCVTMFQEQNNAQNQIQILKVLRLLTRIYFSLNWITIPEFFEDHIKEWHEGFSFFLSYENPALNSDSDDEAGPVELIQTAIIDNVKLYSEKYDEEFAPFLGEFTGKIWKLLQKFGKEEKYDGIVAKGMAFLTSLVSRELNKKLFEEQGALKGICEQIMIPNIMMRESDMERFEDNPIEYIRRDIEGSDNDTRRKSACDLATGMTKVFDDQVTELCKGYIGQMVATNEPIKKDAAIALVISIAIRKSLRSKGVTEVNPKIPLLQIMDNLIVPELKDQNIDANPILKADSLKFVTVFRNQIPRNKMLELLPDFVRFLKAKSYVVHTYAAVAIERLLSVKNKVGAGPLIPVYNAQDIAPYHNAIFTNLFALFDLEESSENEYLARALMRLITVSKETLIPIAGDIIGKFKGILGKVCAQPKNPVFNHYLFESIAALIKYVCNGKPEAVHGFEELLFPPFQQILQMEISEFTPFVYQIMAQMLELGPEGKLSPSYKAVYDNLFHPSLYGNSGDVPGIVRLIEAYMIKHSEATVSQNMTGFLGTVNHLLNKRSTEELAFKLLTAMVMHVDPKHYEQMLVPIFNMLFTRMQNSKSRKTGPAFTKFVSTFIAKHGPGPVVATTESIQSGLFLGSFLGGILVPNLERVITPFDRRNCAIGMTRLICEYQPLTQNAKAWQQIVSAVIKLLKTSKGDLKIDEDEYLETMEETGYSASYSRLIHSRTKHMDYFKDIPNVKHFFAQKINTLCKGNTQILNSLSVDDQQIMMEFYKQAGIQA